MPNDSERIESALARARSRWLNSAMVNAGGRWAVLPGGLIALTGIVLALADERSLGWLLLLAGMGVAGVGAALLVTRRIYARPAAAGAPDWTLLLDRALGLEDALPTWLEAEGDFRTGMEARIAAGLDPEREKQAAPAKHWGGLVIALLLALMPLVFWQPDESQDHQPDTVADTPEGAAEETPAGGGGPSGGGSNGDGEGEGEAPGDNGEGDNSGGGGGEGETRNRPDGGKGETGAGEKPEEAEPTPSDNSPKPDNPNVGDNNTPSEQPKPEPEKEEIPSDIDKVKPKAGDGETTTKPTSKWVYNPDGEKLDGSTPAPRDVNHPGEKAVPRTKMTRKEREDIRKAYRKLYEE